MRSSQVNKAHFIISVLLIVAKQTQECKFPEYLLHNGPWIFQYHQKRDVKTGERLGIVQYAHVYVKNLDNLGEIVISRHTDKVEVTDQGAIKSVTIGQHEEYLLCKEKKKYNIRHSYKWEYVVEHAHLYRTKYPSVPQRTGWMCFKLQKEFDRSNDAKVIGLSLQFGEIEPQKMKLSTCRLREDGDKWMLTPYHPNIGRPEMKCPQKFSYRAVISWIGSENKLRNLRTYPQIEAKEKSRFTLLQSECIFGTGINWLFYDTKDVNFRQLGIFSFRKTLNQVESIKIDMKCAGHWSKYKYEFTLMYDPANPLYLYTLRTTKIRTGERYAVAHLYEGAVEVLSSGDASSLIPTEGHLLSRMDLHHNRYHLEYRNSSGAGHCDDLMKICDDPAKLRETNEWQHVRMYCAGNDAIFAVNDPKCKEEKPVVCSYQDNIHGDWVRRDSNDPSDFTDKGSHGEVTISQDSGDSITMGKWGSVRNPNTIFYCKKKFAMATVVDSILPKDMYVTQIAKDGQCTVGTTCFHFVFPTNLMTNDNDRPKQNKNILFLRIAHNKNLLEADEDDKCEFQDKVVKLPGKNSTKIQGSYFYTLIKKELAKKKDEYAIRKEFPPDVHCDINLYPRYNFTVGRNSAIRKHCIVMMLPAIGNSYSSFIMRYTNGSEECNKVNYINIEHKCLGGYAILTEAVRRNPSKKQYKVIITYSITGVWKNFYCWVVELYRTGEIGKIILYDTPQCKLLFSSEVRSQVVSPGEISPFLEHIEEAQAAATFYNPTVYRNEAHIAEIQQEDKKRRHFYNNDGVNSEMQQKKNVQAKKNTDTPKMERREESQVSRTASRGDSKSASSYIINNHILLTLGALVVLYSL